MFTSLIRMTTVALTGNNIFGFDFLQITLEESMTCSERQQLKCCLSAGVGVVAGHFHLWPKVVEVVDIILPMVGGFPVLFPIKKLLGFDLSFEVGESSGSVLGLLFLCGFVG